MQYLFTAAFLNFDTCNKQHHTPVDVADWPVCETEKAMQLSLRYKTHTILMWLKQYFYYIDNLKFLANIIKWWLEFDQPPPLEGNWGNPGIPDRKGGNSLALSKRFGSPVIFPPGKPPKPGILLVGVLVLPWNPWNWLAPGAPPNGEPWFPPNGLLPKGLVLCEPWGGRLPAVRPGKGLIAWFPLLALVPWGGTAFCMARIIFWILASCDVWVVSKPPPLFPNKDEKSKDGVSVPEPWVSNEDKSKFPPCVVVPPLPGVEVNPELSGNVKPGKRSKK